MGLCGNFAKTANINFILDSHFFEIPQNIILLTFIGTIGISECIHIFYDEWGFFGNLAWSSVSFRPFRRSEIIYEAPASDKITW